MDRKLLFICECHNVEHQLIFSYFEDEPEVYVTTHLNKLPLWERIKSGIKYIFGHKSMYGDFDEFIFNPDDADKLQEVVDHLKAHAQ